MPYYLISCFDDGSQTTFLFLVEDRECLVVCTSKSDRSDSLSIYFGVVPRKELLSAIMYLICNCCFVHRKLWANSLRNLVISSQIP